MNEQMRNYLIASRQWRELRAAGVTWRELRAAGVTWRELLAEGVTLEELRAEGVTLDDVPALKNPYTAILAGVEKEGWLHDQSTFGPNMPQQNVCGTPMCTAGHLVALAGSEGWRLREKYGWVTAAELLHYAAHPHRPVQNFGAIKQEYALAYIRQMAEFEAQDEAGAQGGAA